MIIQGFLICGELSRHFQASFFVFSLRPLLHLFYYPFSSPPAMDCLFFFLRFLCLFLSALGLHAVRAFSSCKELGLLSRRVCVLLTVVSALAVPMPTVSPFPSLKPHVEEGIKDSPGASRAATSGVEICHVSGLHLPRGLSYTRVFLDSSPGPSQTKARTPLPVSYLEFY